MDEFPLWVRAASAYGNYAIFGLALIAAVVAWITGAAETRKREKVEVELTKAAAYLKLARPTLAILGRHWCQRKKASS